MLELKTSVVCRADGEPRQPEAVLQGNTHGGCFDALVRSSTYAGGIEDLEWQVGSFPCVQHGRGSSLTCKKQATGSNFMLADLDLMDGGT